MMPGPLPDDLRIADGTAILSALESLPEWREPSWADLGFPVVDRGRHAIFPLAVAALTEGATPDAARRLLGECERLTLHAVHCYGGDFFHAESALDVEAGYGRRVVEACTVLPDPGRLIWWGIGRLAAILVRSADPSRSVEALALHVVPKEWVWRWPPHPTTKRDASRARRMAREQAAADASWSWPIPDTGA